MSLFIRTPKLVPFIYLNSQRFQSVVSDKLVPTICTWCTHTIFLNVIPFCYQEGISCWCWWGPFALQMLCLHQNEKKILMIQNFLWLMTTFCLYLLHLLPSSYQYNPNFISVWIFITEWDPDSVSINKKTSIWWKQ